MIDFLIKSATSMAVFLAIYQLFLEREKMHLFNRFYLLGSLALSLVLPFITITIYTPAAAVAENIFESGVLNKVPPIAERVPDKDYTSYVIWGLYTLVTFFMMVRFLKNIQYFTKKIRSGKIVPYKSSKFVLVEENILPHTFLNYIFLNRKSHEDRAIEDELYTHELVHANQKHTLDILFVEVLKVALWFNPLLYRYKNAIQLNHEFLADENVIALTKDVIPYQLLLLKKVAPATNYPLASSFNFSITKKRLIMMTRTTSKSRALVAKLSPLLVIAGLLFFLCIESVAQNKTTASKKKPATTTHNQTGDQRRDAYYKGVWVAIDDQTLNLKINKVYDELTEAEKDRYLFYAPEVYAIKHPTKKEFESFKNKKGYALQIDGKDVDNAILNKHKPEDFAYYSGYTMSRKALTKERPQIFHYQLYTRPYFDKNLKGTNLVYPGKIFEMTITNEIVNDEPLIRHSKGGIKKSNK